MNKNMIGTILLVINFLPVSLSAGQIKQGLAQNEMPMFVSGEGTQVLLEESLDMMEEKFDVNILFRPYQVRDKYTSRQNTFSDSLGLELEELLTPLNMTFERINKKNYIILNKDELVVKEVIQETVTGQITDAQSGETLPGVNVMIKGTTTGTSTGSDGTFELTVESLQDTLVFSFVGYQTQEVPIAGHTEIDIVLQPQAVTGDEVVVTAMGRSREAKQLTFATQQVDGEDISATVHSDISSSLQGKVAGMTVRQVSGEPGVGSKITIRGSNSLTGNNDPLYVVDGFPVGTSIDFSINSNNIKSINVLKGAKAAALYGLRASNGVILITTKSGDNNELNSPSITINSDYTLDRMSVYPNHQKIYAQGSNREFQPYSAFSWGPRIDEMGTYINQLGEEEEARAYDNIRDFFQIGSTINNSVNISNRFDQGNYSLGLNQTKQKGIIPKSGMDLYTANLSFDYNLNSKIRLSSTVNYSDFNYTTSEEVGGSAIRFAAFNTPPSYNLKGKPIHEPGDPYNQINFRGQHNNIYWAVNNNELVRKRSVFSGSFGLNYDVKNWININYRFGYKGNFGSEYFHRSIGSAPDGLTNPPSGGLIEEDLSRNHIINSNFNLTFQNSFSNDIDFELLLGHEFNNIAGRGLSSTGSDLNVPGFYSLSNAANINSNQSINQQRSYGIFGNLNIGWKDMLYLDVAVRNDVVSNMPRQNRSFLYPSVGTGFIFSELLKSQQILSFGKLRINYGEVGQTGPIFATRQIFTEGDAFTFPFEGINAFSMSSSLNSSDLEPENTRTFEYGIDLSFFENRLKLDYTYFDSKVSGQILRVPTPNSTGYSSELRNAGKMRNKGHEIMLSYQFIKKQNFNWELTSNFTSYTNKVVELADGIEELTLGGTGSTSIVVAVPGEEYPILKGNGYVRHPETNKIIVDSREMLPNGNENPNYGMPLVTPNPIYFGKANPDFELNFLNTIQYKNFTFSFQIDWRQGGKLGSNQTRMSYLYGTHPATLEREQDVVLNAAKGYFDESGELVIVNETNDITIQKGFQYFRVRGDQIQESKIFDASFIRVRELSLNYQFPSLLLEKTPLKIGSSVYLMGRNLWLIKSGLPEYDPEMSTGGRDIGWDSLTYPQVMNVGMGINLKF